MGILAELFECGLPPGTDRPLNAEQVAYYAKLDAKGIYTKDAEAEYMPQHLAEYAKDLQNARVKGPVQ